MANTLDINKIYSTVASIASQATGETVLTPVDHYTFVTVGQTALKTGYDKVIGAISQVLSNTIFSSRVYDGHFPKLRADTMKWGNWVRKITPCDIPLADDVAYDLTDGQSIDQYTVRKPKALQLNFYGGQTYERYYTVFRDQLDIAFSSAEEFSRFWSAITTNVRNQIVTEDESMVRAAVANFIIGKVEIGGAGVVHLLTEYNTATGASFTSTDVKKPENFKPFMEWVRARIATLSDMMTERSNLFHQTVTGCNINRHTPYNKQHLYIYSPVLRDNETRVLSGAFNDGYLKYADVESVNYWQSIKTPDTVKGKAVYLKPDGSLFEMGTVKTVDNIFGVLFDDDAIGWTKLRSSVENTPFNARGRYYNVFYNWQNRWVNDFTENGIVLLLD